MNSIDYNNSFELSKEYNIIYYMNHIIIINYNLDINNLSIQIITNKLIILLHERFYKIILNENKNLTTVDFLKDIEYIFGKLKIKENNINKEDIKTKTDNFNFSIIFEIIIISNNILLSIKLLYSILLI